MTDDLIRRIEQTYREVMGVVPITQRLSELLQELEPMDEIDELKQEIQALREIVKEVSEDYWVVGEVYNKCFFCGTQFDEEESDHQEDCLAMRAKRLLRKSIGQ